MSVFQVSTQQLATVTTIQEAANEAEARQIVEQKLAGELACAPEEFGDTVYSAPRVVKVKKQEG